MLAVIMLAVIKVTSYGGEDHRSEHRIPGAVVFGLDVRAKSAFVAFTRSQAHFRISEAAPAPDWSSIGGVVLAIACASISLASRRLFTSRRAASGSLAA